ncbi:fumarate hydratase [Candidatus Omnitrophota bacterium]
MAREVNVQAVETLVKELCIEANLVLRTDVLDELKEAYEKEKDESSAKKVLGVLVENAKIAKEERLPICQDTGAAAVFLEIGEEVHFTGNVKDAVNSGVEDAYNEANLRKSIVSDPIMRENTGTNTPAFVHIDIAKGDKINISVMPKGFGSENKSRTVMLNPTCGEDAIIDFCVETVKLAGPDGCPPYVLGIGIGGTMDACTLEAKKALLRPINKDNPSRHIAEMEKKIKEKANSLDIGVMGLGGNSTVIGVNINEIHTHIAGMPVAVNISCHALRSATGTI